MFIKSLHYPLFGYKDSYNKAYMQKNIGFFPQNNV